MNRLKKDKCKAQHLGPTEYMMQMGNLFNKELCIKLSAGCSATVTMWVYRARTDKGTSDQFGYMNRTMVSETREVKAFFLLGSPKHS